jgi:hypothetical protein
MRILWRRSNNGRGLDTKFQNVLSTTGNGNVLITMDEFRVAGVAQKIAFGLYIHRYRCVKKLKIGDFFAVKPTDIHDPDNFILMLAHNERFQPRRWTHMQTVCSEKSKVQIFDYMFVRNWVYADLGKTILHHAFPRDPLGGCALSEPIRN